VYQALARRCRASLVPTQALTEADPARQRFTPAQLTAGVSEAALGLKPLVEVKRS
jgi:hypothetical protein